MTTTGGQNKADERLTRMAFHVSCLNSGDCSARRIGSDIKHVSLYFWHAWLHRWKLLTILGIATVLIALFVIRPFEGGAKDALHRWFAPSRWKDSSLWLSWSGEWLYHLLVVGGLWGLGTILRSRRLQVLGISVLIAIAAASVTSRMGKTGFGRLRPIVAERHELPDTFIGPTFRAKTYVVGDVADLKATKFQSFPSGHTTAGFATSMPIQLVHPVIGIPFTTYSAIISLSRTYNNQHYPSDLFAGLILGMVCSLPTRRLFKEMRAEIRPEVE